MTEPEQMGTITAADWGRSLKDARSRPNRILEQIRQLAPQPVFDSPPTYVSELYDRGLLPGLELEP